MFKIRIGSKTFGRLSIGSSNLGSIQKSAPVFVQPITPTPVPTSTTSTTLPITTSTSTTTIAGSWILATGIWNDGGVWIDTSNWID
jgi:hypothetical protein